MIGTAGAALAVYVALACAGAACAVTARAVIAAAAGLACAITSPALGTHLRLDEEARSGGSAEDAAAVASP